MKTAELSQRTPFEHKLDPNFICQALAKWFQENAVSVNWMNVASDMAWIVRYMIGPDSKQGELLDMIIGFDANGFTHSAFYWTGKTDLIGICLGFGMRYLKCSFTRSGDGLECEWYEVSEGKAQRAIREWNKDIVCRYVDKPLDMYFDVSMPQPSPLRTLDNSMIKDTLRLYKKTGSKLEAIQYIRHQTGSSLQTAVDWCNDNITHPDLS